jgi:hypothetical protein
MEKSIILKNTKLTFSHNLFVSAVSALLCFWSVACSSGDDDASDNDLKGGKGGSSTTAEEGGAGAGGTSTKTTAAGGAGGSSTTTSAAGASGSTTNTAGTSAVVVGYFNIKLIPANAGADPYTSVNGFVYDGRSIELKFWKESYSDGVCKLLAQWVPSCATDCGGTARCAETEKCVPVPNPVDAGIVTVKGVRTQAGATEFTMEWIKNYQSSETLPYPAFSEGDDITVSAAGSSSVGAFTLTAKGISPIELLNDSIALVNKDLTLTWKAPTKSDASKIEVTLNIANHEGALENKIVCTPEDKGTLTVPAAMVRKLVSLGVAGKPTLVIKRTSTGAATISTGQVNLTVVSEIERDVSITGLITCSEDKNCAAVSGMVCGTTAVCELPCTADNNCPTGYPCEKTAGICKPRCLTNSDCQTGYTCQEDFSCKQ